MAAAAAPFAETLQINFDLIAARVTNRGSGDSNTKDKPIEYNCCAIIEIEINVYIIRCHSVPKRADSINLY